MAKKNSSTVLWWLGWITLTIVSFFVASWFWTGFIAERVGDMQKPGVPILWISAVFGTWMVFLIPLIIVMYHKVDKAYEDARIAREKARLGSTPKEFNVKSIHVDDSQRLLRKELTGKLRSYPEAIRRGHLVTAVLKDGRRVENVFVLNRKNVLGVYGVEDLTFRIGDIVDVEPADLDHLPDFKTENWLRLDGQ